MTGRSRKKSPLVINFGSGLLGLLSVNQRPLDNLPHSGFQLKFPAKVAYAFFGIFAYGPLEMFFFVWLVKNTEEVFRNKNGSFLLSVSITSIL